MTRSGKYIEIQRAEISSMVRFDVPRQKQGQIVEIAYGTFGRGEACHGDPYKRVIDKSGGLGAERYYKWIERAV